MSVFNEFKRIYKKDNPENIKKKLMSLSKFDTVVVLIMQIL